MRKKLGLVLGSGGSRGVAHIGALKAFEEEGIRPDYITGCSMGAVVGACYSAGMHIEEMYDTVMNIKPFDLIDLGVGFNRTAFLKGNKMHEMLLDKLGDITFDRLSIPFRCVASDLLSGKSVVLHEGEVAKAVRASSSIPLVFEPVEYDGKKLVDGCVLCRVPTQQARDMGADIIIAVDVLANASEPVSDVKGIIPMIMRVFDMCDSNATAMKKRLYDGADTFWIVPEMKGISQYRIKELQRAYDEGYALTKKLMPEIKEFIKNGSV